MAKRELGEAAELIIPLPNGGSLCCGAVPSGQMYGDYVRICDAKGNEILYWDCQEWQEDPVLVMGAIFGASLKSIAELTADRTLEDGCWNYDRRKAERLHRGQAKTKA